MPSYSIYSILTALLHGMTKLHFRSSLVCKRPPAGMRCCLGLRHRSQFSKNSLKYKKSTVGSEIMASEDVPIPAPGNWICYFTRQKGLCRCDQGSLDEDTILDYLGIPNFIITVILISRTGTQESQSQRDVKML